MSAATSVLYATEAAADAARERLESCHDEKFVVRSTTCAFTDQNGRSQTAVAYFLSEKEEPLEGRKT